jgi:hypothetical protein
MSKCNCDNPPCLPCSQKAEQILSPQEQILKFLGLDAERVITLSLTMDIHSVVVTTELILGDLDQTVNRTFKLVEED